MNLLSYYLLDWVAQQGIEHAFVLTGADINAVVTALRYNEKIKPVYVTSETVAVNMAEGYGRRTGRPSLVIACGGPGLAGLVAGVVQAGASGCPILYVTGVTSCSQDEAGWLVPDRPLIAAAMCETLALHEPDQLPAVLAQAGRLLALGQQVHIQISTVALTAACKCHEIRSELANFVPTPMEFTGLFVFAVGGPALGYAEDIAALAMSKGVPVITDMTARGVLPESHQLALGHLTFSPSRLAIAALDPASALRVSRVIALAPGPALLSALRQLDISPQVIGALELDDWLGQAKGGLTSSTSRKNWVQSLHLAHPRRDPCKVTQDRMSHGLVVTLAQEVLHPQTVHVVDAGVFHQSAVARLRACSPRTILSTDTLTSMGWSFGAAMGAALASEGRPVVAYSGDGSFHIQGLSLAIASRLGLGVLFIIGINGVYASARAKHAPGRDDPALVPPCDILVVARACGVDAQACVDVFSLRQALAAFDPTKGPQLLTVPVGLADTFVESRSLGIVGLDALS